MITKIEKHVEGLAAKTATLDVQAHLVRVMAPVIFGTNGTSCAIVLKVKETLNGHVCHIDDVLPYGDTDEMCATFGPEYMDGVLAGEFNLAPATSHSTYDVDEAIIYYEGLFYAPSTATMHLEG